MAHLSTGLPHLESHSVKGGRYLPYLEKKIDFWALLTHFTQRKIMVILAPSRYIGILHRPTVTVRASRQGPYWSRHHPFLDHKKSLQNNYINFRGNDSSMAGC